ncbi:MAG: hypothetical protein NT023_09015 [Armatimonadetes bacterium]|nr:hypothetical protein [Armatimonadota bacterium]
MAEEGQTLRLQIGYIPTGNISVVLYHWRHLFLRYGFVVIVCVDSDDEPAEYRDVEECFLKAGCVVEKLEGRFIIPNGETTLDTIIETFTGFDEIWFYDKKPSAHLGRSHLATGRVITDTEDPFHEMMVQSLCSEMLASGARVGLGDGVGLNYASTDSLVSAAFEQRPDHQKLECLAKY